MKKLFRRVKEDKEENTLFGTLDHWVEIKASTLNYMRFMWFAFGNATMLAFLYFVGVYYDGK